MANYNDAQALLQQLKPIINQCIDNHPSVKSAIKAKKATVENVDTAKKTVTVRFPFDATLVTLPYNSQMESYLTTGTAKGKTVSVWFYQSLSNGIVMQDGAWQSGGDDELETEIANLQTQINNKLPLSGGMVNGDIGVDGCLYSSGSKPIYILPYVPYSQIDPTHDTETYMKNLLKWICRNYPSVEGGLWIGIANPNSDGRVIIDIYDTSKVNSEGLPEYSTGIYQSISTTLITFCTYSYNFSIRWI